MGEVRIIEWWEMEVGWVFGGKSDVDSLCDVEVPSNTFICCCIRGAYEAVVIAVRVI